MNLHNLALLSINKTYTIFGEKRAKGFSVDSVSTSAKQWRRGGLLKTALLIEPTSWRSFFPPKAIRNSQTSFCEISRLTKTLIPHESENR